VAELTAYRLGLTPAEFDDLQPQELYKLVEAHQLEQKEKDYRTSYFLSWIINTQVKKPISTSDIFDPLWLTTEDKKQKALEERQHLIKEFGLEVKK